MSRIHRWSGTVDEMTDEHVFVSMWVTPSGDIESWKIPRAKLPVEPNFGHIVNVRVCPRRVRITMTDRQGRKL